MLAGLIPSLTGVSFYFAHDFLSQEPGKGWPGQVSLETTHTVVAEMSAGATVIRGPAAPGVPEGHSGGCTGE